jgi:TPR repeat protein
LAHWNLAGSYRGSGWPVTEKDPRKAIEHLEKAGELGMVQAWYELGVLYQAGYEVPKDEVKAFEWFQKAPYFAANYLGIAYWEGRITKRNFQKARLYLLDASQRDRIGVEGRSVLAAIYGRGLGVGKDPVLAARFSPLIVDEPAKPPAEPKVRKPWAGDRKSVIDIQWLLQKDSPASSWLEYGKALIKVTRISSAAIALARASELGSSEAEMTLGQLYIGDWGISSSDDIQIVEPLQLDPVKGKALIASATRKGVKPPKAVDAEDVQGGDETRLEVEKYEGQDPRRLYYLIGIWNSKGGC